MTTPTQSNDPRRTWPLASYQAVERRKNPAERRADPQRATKGDRRAGERRSLRSLLRF